MSGSDDALAAAVRELADPVAEPLGVEILSVGVTGPRGRRLVRVVADLRDPDAEGGPDVDTITALSRELGGALDLHDPIAGGYTLEVTSPGADRPLTRPRDFARNVGREVRVTRGEGEGQQVLVGTVVSADEQGVTLATGQGEVRVELAAVHDARVVLPW